MSWKCSFLCSIHLRALFFLFLLQIIILLLLVWLSLPRKITYELTTQSRIKKVVLELKDNKLVTVQPLGYSASKSFLLHTFEVPYYNKITIFLPNKLQVSIQVKNSHLLKMCIYIVIVSITYCINLSSNSVTVSLNIVT